MHETPKFIGVFCLPSKRLWYYEDMSEHYYTPGVCNINEPEIAYRKKAFYLGIATGVPLLVFLLVVKASPYTAIVMFLPVWIGAIGYLQAKNKFCVGYAASGLFNSSPEYAETKAIVDESSKKLDKARARKINYQALGIGLIGASLSSFLLFVI